MTQIQQQLRIISTDSKINYRQPHLRVIPYKIMIPSPALQKRVLKGYRHAFETLKVFDALHRRKQVMG